MTARQMVDEVERLRGELEVALANRQAFQDDMLSANSRLADENSRLRAELAAVKAEPIRPVLTWATTPPTKPGHYWARDPAEPNVRPRLVTFRRNSDGELRSDCYAVPDGAEWWGPIPRPPEKSP